MKVWNTETADCSNKNFPDFVGLEQFKCIIGHLNFSNAIKNQDFNNLFLQNKIIAHSVVREPIDRMISLYNYTLVNKQVPGHERILSVTPCDFLNNQPNNYQVTWLGIEYFKNIENIRKNINVVSLEISNQYFQQFFAQEFAFQTPLMKKLNVTEQDFPTTTSLFKREMLTEVQERQLKEKHFLDYELYNSLFD